VDEEKQTLVLLLPTAMDLPKPCVLLMTPVKFTDA
jgi:hypothetical protein